ncbi:cell envelope-related function transcriptional attenuator common domain protein [[Clostridium] bifermentans ATCC 19299]|uniref:LCP family protein n=1 Tax=Paraclostridium bifermentans TaxID=1490 RepID=UPI00038DA59D|nr:LCP family protein [Paraclostridium bifermentans]EQK45887.1 cell envelope-related function transcriptional attenuator common domain protein [[Clostridium] bifermentans ATCC 19299] [Paraclostridium bifermentans ATCC 19299]
MSTFKKIVIGLVIFIVAVPMVAFGYFYFKLNSIYDSSAAKDVKEKVEKADDKDGITNILLAGVDGNNLDKGNRSDSMMVLTIDEKNNDIRITSLARDTYVQIPGYGEEKLTHAYAYGGPALLLQTIDKNFGLKIDKYAVVSFSSFEKIIDAMGGVEIDVLPKEVSYIQGVDSAGKQTLNGAEALAYSRIRYADDAYQRDNRQRTVMQAAYNKLASNPGDLMEIGNTILGYTKTNMPPMEIFKLANKVIKMNFTEFPQLEFPLDGHREGKTVSQEKGWVILWDKEYNNEQLKKFIFDYKNYTQQ